jgi:hypothetical protein
MAGSYPLNGHSREEALKLLEELAAAVRAVPSAADFDRTRPRPEGALRVTPTF